MSIQGALTIVVLLCAQQAFTRYAQLNVSFNLSASLSDENNHLTEEIVRICMKETQLSMAALEQLKTNEIANHEVDESTQCFVHCLYEHMGVMRNGLFVDNDDTQKLVTVMDDENADFAVCRSIRGNNKCETAYKIHQCVQKVRNNSVSRDQTQAMITDANNINRNGDDDDESSDNESGQ